MLNSADFKKISKWMYRNARPLELAKFQYHFEGGKKEPVLDMISMYQNPDGGFGNALEADNWNPNSSPYTTMYACDFLEDLEFEDKEHPITKGILAFLENTEHFADGKWLAVIPTNNEYPRAMWWTDTDGAQNLFGYTPAAKLAGFALRFASKGSPVYDKAFQVAKEAVDVYLNGINEDNTPYRSVQREAEINNLYYLSTSIRKAGLSTSFDLSSLEKAMIDQGMQFIERDKAKWGSYSYKPSVLLKRPDSIFYEGNESIIIEELGYLAENRNQDGMWDITWQWYYDIPGKPQTNGTYAGEFAIAANWWKAEKAIEHLLLFQAFDMLDMPQAIREV